MTWGNKQLSGRKPVSIGPPETCLRPGSSLPSPRAPSNPLTEMLPKLCVLLITQRFEGRQPQSSLLVYFTGVPGISSNGGHFLAANLFTPYLSALIYIQQLFFLEYALPCRVYVNLNWSCRPRTDHFSRLNRARHQYMLPGSLTPLGETQNLRALANARLSLILQLPSINEALMVVTFLLDLHATVDLNVIYEPLVDRRPGQFLCQQFFQPASRSILLVGWSGCWAMYTWINSKETW